MKHGFRKYIHYTKEVSKVRQIYYFTKHLYDEENEELSKIPNEERKDTDTSIGKSHYNLDSLKQYTEEFFPSKLRELLSINLVTLTESFLTEVVKEVYRRDISPFKNNKDIRYKKGEILSFSSVHELRDDIIESKIRSLTSGGLGEIEKFYRRTFDIDFRSLDMKNGKYYDVEEFFDRRHLYVHSEGYCDSEYSHEYPELGYSPGDRVPINEEYFLRSLELLKSFGHSVHEKLALRYPDDTSNFETVNAHNSISSDHDIVLLVHVDIIDKGINPNEDIPSLTVNPHADEVNQRTLSEFACKVFTFESRDEVVISGSQSEINTAMYPLKHTRGIEFRRAVKLTD